MLTKNYFVMPNELMELYQTRTISAVDVAVYAALCSLRRNCDGVRLSQRMIAITCNITPKTVAASVRRLYSCGLIANVITPTAKSAKKYETSVYQLKTLPDNDFFFAPRHILRQTDIKPKMFAVYFFLCCANHNEYGKSWNSYNDLCLKTGFGKGQRSEMIKLIGSLVELGLIEKTVRKIDGVYVDNIYRISGLDD